MKRFWIGAILHKSNFSSSLSRWHSYNIDLPGWWSYAAGEGWDRAQPTESHYILTQSYTPTPDADPYAVQDNLWDVYLSTIRKQQQWIKWHTSCWPHATEWVECAVWFCVSVSGVRRWRRVWLWRTDSWLQPTQQPRGSEGAARGRRNVSKRGWTGTEISSRAEMLHLGLDGTERRTAAEQGFNAAGPSRWRSCTAALKTELIPHRCIWKETDLLLGKDDCKIHSLWYKCCFFNFKLFGLRRSSFFLPVCLHASLPMSSLLCE